MTQNKNNQSLGSKSDNELVAILQARTGQTQTAFAALIGRYRADLLRRCNARLGNRADAEDAVQETLVRAFRGALRFRGDACFRTWLYAIADNQCNTLYRRRANRMLSDHVRALIALDYESHDEAARHDTGLIDTVRETLDELPHGASDVLLLRFYSDLSIEDIATTLGIGLSAAKMRLYRSIALFRSLICAGVNEMPA